MTCHPIWCGVTVTHLVCPLEDDPLDSILGHHVDPPPIRGPHPDLLVLDGCGSLLGEWEQGPALDVASDLMNSRGKLMILFPYI